MTNDLRSAMNRALKESAMPILRSRGFKGSLPHLRRMTGEAVELLTFQFDKWGGGFVIEIARCSDTGFTTAWGKHIPANKVSAHDLHPYRRKRIQPRAGGETEAWFRYDDGNVGRAVLELLDCLPEAEAWWQHNALRGVEAEAARDSALDILPT